MSNYNEIFTLKKLKNKRPLESNLRNKQKYHPTFCQLSEIHLNPRRELVWLETARCLKFIEYVEENGRWSKPYVSTVSISSILILKKLIINGLVVLNNQPKPYRSFVDELTDNLINEKLIDENEKDKLKRTLLLPHFHQYQKEYITQLDMGEKLKLKRKSKLKDTNQNEEDKFDEKQGTNIQLKIIGEENEDDLDESVSVDLESIDTENTIDFDFQNKRFYKKLPENSKAANILIGEIDFLKEEVLALIKFPQQTLFFNITEVPIPTKYFFVLLGPSGNINKYRKIAKCVSTLFSDELFQSDINEANDKQDIILAIDEFLEQSILIPPGQWDYNIRLGPPEKTASKEERLVVKMKDVVKDKPHIGGHDHDPSLRRTGRLFGGLIEDIKRKKRWYISDFKDALNFQCFPAIAFLYFACLSPIITFGGLLGYATDQNMGTIESLLSGLICGVTYSLFSGQPMTIMGSTGPVLVFESILNMFCKSYDIDYIGFRCWVGCWVTLFLLIITITDLSFLVKYITRFTEELFAILIALIFVNESIDKLLKIKNTHNYSNNPFLYKNYFNENSTSCFRCLHKNSSRDENIYILNETVYTERDCENLGHDYQFLRECKYIPDVFFFCVILYVGTFLMSMSLRQIKFTNFFPAWIRSKLSNFGVVITIAVMISIDYYVGLDTPKLHVPSEFHPTIPDRGWFINPLVRNEGKWWLIFLAIPPGFLATILIFMDQHITAVLVNRKGNKLKKSGGYHLDLLICAICIGVNSFLGLPWFVAATVLSMNHVIALRKIQESTVPGEAPKLIGVIEQRVTGIIIFVLIGCSIFATRILVLIPMAVLYAIFMYMGVTPMGELEFVQRILLMLMPNKYQPDLVYLRHVRLSRVHLFTSIQLVCLAILFFLKLNKKISITFPLMVLALVFIRFGLSYVFTEKELSFLDDIIPGTGTKKKKILNLNEVNVELLEKARKELVTSKIDKSYKDEEMLLAQNINENKIYN